MYTYFFPALMHRGVSTVKFRYIKKNTPKIQGLLQVNYHDRLRFAESILGKKFNFDNYMYIEHIHMYTQFHSVSEILVKKRHIYLKSAWIHSKAKH